MHIIFLFHFHIRSTEAVLCPFIYLFFNLTCVNRSDNQILLTWERRKSRQWSCRFWSGSTGICALWRPFASCHTLLPSPSRHMASISGPSMRSSFKYSVRTVKSRCKIPNVKTSTSFEARNEFFRLLMNKVLWIFYTGLSITKRKPSVIAASALVAASDFLYSPLHETFLHRLIEDGIIKEVFSPES